MSVKENLLEQRQQLVLQRAVLKDQLEQNDKSLNVINFAIQAIDAVAAENAPAEEVTED